MYFLFFFCQLTNVLTRRYKHSQMTIATDSENGGSFSTGSLIVLLLYERVSTGVLVLTHFVVFNSLLKAL